MTFIETPATRRYPWYVRLLFALQRRHYDRVLEPARLWGRTPRAFFAMALMYAALDRKSSPIDPRLRSLLQVRISQINGCLFCVDLNAATGMKRGASAEQFAALTQFEIAAEFSSHEKAALAFADAVTRSDRRPDAALIARLRAHFADDAIVELAALIAYQNMSSKFNTALGVPAQGFCRVHIPEERLWQPTPSAE
jgi:AhpD family alkylhydroperoxidase